MRGFEHRPLGLEEEYALQEGKCSNKKKGCPPLGGGELPRPRHNKKKDCSKNRPPRGGTAYQKKKEGFCEKKKQWEEDR